METGKTQQRLGLIIQSIAQNIAAPLFSLFLSWMVINLQNEGLWGQFVKVQVWVMIVVQVFAFGNKEYLLRSFSKDPSQMEFNWSRSFFSRGFFLCVLTVLFIVSPISFHLKGWIITWCIVRFVYQSFDVVVLYKKQFYLSILAEVLGLLLLFVALYKPMANPTLGHLLRIYVVADLLKAGFMLLVYHGMINLSFFRQFNLGYFKGAFLFFLLGFTGLVATRTDQLCINHFMQPASIAQYQVLTTFFVFAQALSNFILSPFLKNMYRIELSSFLAIRKKLFLFGIIILLPLFLILHYIMVHFYHFDFPVQVYLLGIFYVLPVYYYSPIVHLLFRNNREKKVIQMNLIFILVNLGLNIFLIPAWGMTGALVATGISQNIILFYLSWYQRKLFSRST